MNSNALEMIKSHLVRSGLSGHELFSFLDLFGSCLDASFDGSLRVKRMCSSNQCGCFERLKEFPGLDCLDQRDGWLGVVFNGNWTVAVERRGDRGRAAITKASP